MNLKMKGLLLLAVFSSAHAETTNYKAEIETSSIDKKSMSLRETGIVGFSVDGLVKKDDAIVHAISNADSKSFTIDRIVTNEVESDAKSVRVDSMSGSSSDLDKRLNQFNLTASLAVDADQLDLTKLKKADGNYETDVSAADFFAGGDSGADAVVFLRRTDVAQRFRGDQDINVYDLALDNGSKIEMDVVLGDIKSHVKINYEADKAYMLTGKIKNGKLVDDAWTVHALDVTDAKVKEQLAAVGVSGALNLKQNLTVTYARLEALRRLAAQVADGDRGFDGAANLYDTAIANLKMDRLIKTLTGSKTNRMTAEAVVAAGSSIANALLSKSIIASQDISVGDVSDDFSTVIHSANNVYKNTMQPYTKDAEGAIEVPADPGNAQDRHDFTKFWDNSKLGREVFANAFKATLDAGALSYALKPGAVADQLADLDVNGLYMGGLLPSTSSQTSIASLFDIATYDATEELKDISMALGSGVYVLSKKGTPDANAVITDLTVTGATDFFDAADKLKEDLHLSDNRAERFGLSSAAASANVTADVHGLNPITMSLADYLAVLTSDDTKLSSKVVRVLNEEVAKDIEARKEDGKAQVKAVLDLINKNELSANQFRAFNGKGQVTEGIVAGDEYNFGQRTMIVVKNKPENADKAVYTVHYALPGKKLSVTENKADDSDQVVSLTVTGGIEVTKDYSIETKIKSALHDLAGIEEVAVFDAEELRAKLVGVNVLSASEIDLVVEQHKNKYETEQKHKLFVQKLNVAFRDLLEGYSDTVKNSALFKSVQEAMDKLQMALGVKKAPTTNTPPAVTPKLLGQLLKDGADVPYTNAELKGKSDEQIKTEVYGAVKDNLKDADTNADMFLTKVKGLLQAGNVGGAGAQQPTGTTGTQQPTGTTGTQQPTGTTGAQQPTGTTGAQQPTGTTGAQQPTGTTGTQPAAGSVVVGKTATAEQITKIKEIFSGYEFQGKISVKNGEVFDGNESLGFDARLA